MDYFCPRHGCVMKFIETVPDVAVVHYIYRCPLCNKNWEVTEFLDGSITLAELLEESDEIG